MDTARLLSIINHQSPINNPAGAGADILSFSGKNLGAEGNFLGIDLTLDPDFKL